jgi:hypothetical protein
MDSKRARVVTFPLTVRRKPKSYLIESLKDPAEAAAYLDAVLKMAILSILYWP